MQILFRAIAFIYLFIFVARSIFAKYIKFGKNTEKYFWILFTMALSYLAFTIQPLNDWDLYIHLRYMKEIIVSEISFIDFLFDNNNFVGGYEFVSFFTFNTIRYIIARIFQNVHVLPFFCVLVDYSIFSYITYNWLKKKNIKINFLILGVCFTLMPYLHAVSGIRNALAASIIGLGIYLYLIENKKIWIFIILGFISAFIHPVVIIAVPFVFLGKFNIGNKGLIIVFMIPAFIQLVMRMCSKSNIHYVKRISYLFLKYNSNNQYRGSRYYMYGCLVIIIIIFLLSLFNNKNEYRQYKLFLLYFSCYILGNLGNYDMVLRPSYVLGVLSAPTISIIFENVKKDSFINDRMLFVYKGILYAISCVLSILYMAKFCQAL